MNILRLQLVADPRSYKIVKSLQSFAGVNVSNGVYGALPCYECFAEYACDPLQIGPLRFPENRPLSSLLNWIIYNGNLLLGPQNRLLSRNIVKAARLTGAELLHTSGPPDVLGVMAKKHTGLPVVHEIYDTTSLYDLHLQDPRRRPFSIGSPLTFAVWTCTTKRSLEWEESVHKRCDALVYTSDEMRRVSEERYGAFKSVIIPNGVLKECLPAQRKEKLSKRDGRIHCVYLGVVTPAMPHRDIASQFHKIAELRDVVLHIYPVTSGRNETEVLRMSLGNRSNVIVHEPLHYRDLYGEITQYDLGLVVLNPSDERLLNTAVPNKVFEYAAAGLPMAVPDYESLRNFVVKYRCGFVVQDWSTDIFQNLGMVREVPFREEFTIDYYMPRLVELYRHLI